jgi:hypothetical protein
MNKTLIALGIVAAAALPAAAFAHPVVEVGVGFGAPVYAPAPVVYPGYAYGYGPTVVYPGYYGYHYGYRR